MTRIEQIGDCTLYLGDCREILPTLPKVDAVVTDPPFGIGNFVQTTGNVRGSRVQWNDAVPDQKIFEMIRQISSHRIIWGANFFNCFDPKGGAIVWDKAQPMPDFSKADIASCSKYAKTEMVRVPWTNFVAASKKETDHPCERPVALYDWCIRYLGMPSSVLDPFLGSGSCGVAAATLGRRFIGIEIEPKYFDIACKRIEAAYAQPDMFIETAKPKAEQLSLLGATS